jgi:orotate phosphoribosyltransferase
MEVYLIMNKQEFVNFLLSKKALKLRNDGDPEGLFTLKSGRRSPFFMNMGDLNRGEDLNILGEAYAKAAYEQWGRGIDVFFGPAYKAIALATATAMFYNNICNGEARYCADRKEVKDHGDVGGFVGAKLQDGQRVVIIEDVTTSGKSMSEVVPKIRAAANVEILGLIVSFDRMEYGKNKDMTALEEIAEEYGFKTIAITSIANAVAEAGLSEEELDRFRTYYKEYGVEGKEIF